MAHAANVRQLVRLYGVSAATAHYARRVYDPQGLDQRGSNDSGACARDSRIQTAWQVAERFGVSVKEWAADEDRFEVAWDHACALSPHPSGVKRESARLLFGLVRHLQPNTVFETGFQTGRSARVILEAMRSNGRGRLISVDIVDRPTAAVDAFGDSFELVVVKSRVHRLLRQQLEQWQPELYFQDSDNRYINQRTELEMALRSCDLVICNNCHVSRGFTSAVEGRPGVMTMREGTRVLGVVRGRRSGGLPLVGL